ncbi:hypothetical protein BN1221_04656 [Brenneria goodwinii]|uniref:Uncharacterized protein n=1 Tax=Brenneria goodwinii TaxID=1109412 RepID=A0A0G4K234_9GAMM|nr:hypothetical protein BN1221_04656 [Brenneria goodwinii]
MAAMTVAIVGNEGSRIRESHGRTGERAGMDKAETMNNDMDGYKKRG